MTQKPSRDELAVAALASGCSNTEAARRSGHSRATIVRRLRDEAFVAAVRQERSSMLERASACLTDAATRATAALDKLLSDESPSIRLASAKAILDHVTKLRDAAEISERLARLEERLEGHDR